jgi:hypothetical protein
VLLTTRCLPRLPDAFQCSLHGSDGYRSALYHMEYLWVNIVYSAGVSLQLVDKNVTNFNVCGSVHLGNVCFIQIQLDELYSFFLKSLKL